MLHFKPEVRFHPVLAMAYAMRIVETVYAEFGVSDVWINSANDSKHKLGSLHYQDRALDFGTKNIPASARPAVHQRIKGLLAPMFDVLWENPGGPNDHFHVEHDPMKENK